MRLRTMMKIMNIMKAMTMDSAVPTPNGLPGARGLATSVARLIAFSSSPSVREGALIYAVTTRAEILTRGNTPPQYP